MSFLHTGGMKKRRGEYDEKPIERDVLSIARIGNLLEIGDQINGSLFQR